MINRFLIHFIISFFVLNGVASFSFAKASDFSRISISFYHQIASDEINFKLNEVARLYGEDKHMIEKINQFVIPSSVYKKTNRNEIGIQQDDLLNILRDEFPNQTFTLLSKVETRIRILNGTVTADTLATISYEYLDRMLSLTGNEYSLSRLSFLENRHLYTNEYSLHARRNTNGIWLARECVWVDVKTKDGFELIDSIPIWYQLKIKDTAMIANTSITKGSHVEKQNFKIFSYDIAGLRHVNPKELENDSYRLKHILSDGQVLTWDDIERVPAIESGGMVKVVSVYNNVEITSVAIALSDADVGEKVRLKLMNSQDGESFVAFVTSRNEAKVSPDVRI